MSDSLVHLMNFLELTDEQKEAAVKRGVDLVVTAGAGSGKTRTLVGRYLGLLSDGLNPRQIVAITFTEKAAREMRSRTRQRLRSLMVQVDLAEERLRWAEVDAQMDSARIGTIHSLCAEILRSHPAEARLDPQFGVIDESQTAVLRASAVQTALAWCVSEEVMTPLLRFFTLNKLEQILSALLTNRLEITTDSFDPFQQSNAVQQSLQKFLSDPITVEIWQQFVSQQHNHTLAADAGEALAQQVADLLVDLDNADMALEQGQLVPAAASLFRMRRVHMRLNIGKRTSLVKDALKELRARYDDLIQSWLGEDDAPNAGIEDAWIEAAPLLAALHSKCLAFYRASQDERGGLDFDDLEERALQLLKNPLICAVWQREVAAVLVDEFQDTNTRQRDIVQALCGDLPGRLFVVGDARQSIYRFRGADVTIFTELRNQIQARGGQAIELDRTFRSHPALLNAMGGLLGSIMGTEVDPRRLYQVPYSALQSKRAAPASPMTSPYVECILAEGDTAETARPKAARALARRLREMKSRNEIQSWDEVAILFRASAVFPIYEQALEEFDIPFATVAGTGFYNRPEVRDLVNMLRVVAAPWDDLAFAGFLRSPAIGVSDAALYQLRVSGEASGMYRPLFEAIQADLGALTPGDRLAAQRGLEILNELKPLVDRMPVAALLQRLVERTDYLAILAACADLPGSSRLWRNVEKLMEDAQAGGIVKVSAFLEMIATMRDVGAREGEAIAEAEGAVRLMTIHKSKGLEFPIVVLGDAARQPNVQRLSAQRLARGWICTPDKLEGVLMAYKLALWQEKLQSEAEDLRILYVALTRTQEKLIINGYLRIDKGQIITQGWLKKILTAGDISPEMLLDAAGSWKVAPLPGGGEWGLLLAVPDGLENDHRAVLTAQRWSETDAVSLQPRLPEAERMIPGYEHRMLSLEMSDPPAWIIGKMVHKALQRWQFPGNPGLESLLRTQAQAGGILEEALINRAVKEAAALLLRFQRHSLYVEMSGALERHPEVPYVGSGEPEVTEWGFIDCLYRTAEDWFLVDFKTDRLQGQIALNAAIESYRLQMERYSRAAQRMLVVMPRLLMCFLNVEGQIVVYELPQKTDLR